MYSSFGYNFFGMHGSQAVQNLLRKPDVTLDELLEEDGISNEIKTFNKKLTDFLTTEANFKQIIDYVIFEATEDEVQFNHKKSFKFPFTCADILGSDSMAIIGSFFKRTSEIKAEGAQSSEKNTNVDLNRDSDDENLDVSVDSQGSPISNKENQSPTNAVSITDDNLDHLDYLFRFLDTSSMNFTSAGYFAKVVNNLFAKRPNMLLAYIYEERPVLLAKLVDHVSSKSIAEFLSKLLSFETCQINNPSDDVYDTERIKTLDLLVKKLAPENDMEVINNSAFLICEIFGKYNSMHGGHSVLGSLLNAEKIDYFFQILAKKDSVSSSAVGLILGNIFAYYILMNAPKHDEYGQIMESQDENRLAFNDTLPLFKSTIENIPSLISYLRSTEGSSFTSQYGANVVPLGNAKLKLIELLIIAMKTNNHSIHTKLAQCEFIETLLDLFLRYEWNSMLHNQVEKMIALVLDNNNQDLKVSLFERADILSFIVRASRQPEYTLPGKNARKIRKGYMAQLVKISNKLAESQDPYVRACIAGNSQWKQYTEAQLAEINKKYRVNFGGKDPRDTREDYDDDEDEHQNEPESEENAGGMFSMLDGAGYYGSQYQKNAEENETNEENEEEQEGFREDIDDDDDANDNEDGGEGTDSKGFYGTLYEESLKQTMLITQDLSEPETEAIINAYLANSNIVDIGENLKEDEGKAEFNENVYWKREEMYSADEVLAELGL